MIILNPYGGLGNQMYGYAYAKALAEEYKEKIYINTFWMKLNGFTTNVKHTLCHEGKENYDNLLGCLYCADDLEKLGPFSAFFHAVRLEIFLIWNIVIKKTPMSKKAEKYLHDSKKGYFGPIGSALSYWPASKCNRKYKYVFGCPSSDKYFKSVSGQVRQKLKVSKEQSKANILMMKEIESCNSVCLHIRRGDYYDNPVYAYLRVCTIDYYRNCISYINKHCKEPVFYVFSNNHQELMWIKKNYMLEGNIKYVDLNNPNYEELRLMYSCKHFIISNSTFSWWASFLAENPDKIVLAPEKWFTEYEGPLDVYRDDMIKISTYPEKDSIDNNIDTSSKLQGGVL